MSDANDLQLRVSAKGGVARAELSRNVTTSYNFFIAINGFI